MFSCDESGAGQPPGRGAAAQHRVWWVLWRVGAAQGGCCTGRMLHRAGVAQLRVWWVLCRPVGSRCLPYSVASTVQHLVWVNLPFLSSDLHLCDHHESCPHKCCQLSGVQPWHERLCAQTAPADAS